MTPTRRDRRRLELVAGLLLTVVIARLAGDRALAAPLLLGQVAPTQDTGGGGLDLNVASLIVAFGTLVAGGVGYLRLRSERPKIVAEVAALNEDRLRDALDDAWKEAERLRQARDRYRGELDTALRRIAALERREDELERRIAELE